MTRATLAASADYADALLTARRAKAILIVGLLLVLVAELSLFFGLRYYGPLASAGRRERAVVQYVVGLLDFAGLILPALLSVVIWLILQIQLVGRLLGTARMVSAFLLSVLLVLLLFPWQAVLNNPAISSDPLGNQLGMKIPGVIYTWAEVSNPSVGASFGLHEPVANATARDIPGLVLHWARYVGFPVLSILILTNIHFKTRRSLRQSLGEDTVRQATNPPL